jgi:hypothetical protein
MVVDCWCGGSIKLQLFRGGVSGELGGKPVWWTRTKLTGFDEEGADGGGTQGVYCRAVVEGDLVCSHACIWLVAVRVDRWRAGIGSG